MVEEAFRAEGIIRSLNRFGVEYVVIGAFAAIAQGVPIPATYDIDVVPNASTENLGRLSEALKALKATVRTGKEGDDVRLNPSPEMLRAVEILNLHCEYGSVDLMFAPSGGKRFAELDESSITIVVGTTETRVASLRDIIGSKRAAGRAKDLSVLPELERFLDRGNRGPGLER